MYKWAKNFLYAERSRTDEAERVQVLEAAEKEAHAKGEKVIAKAKAMWYRSLPYGLNLVLRGVY